MNHYVKSSSKLEKHSQNSNHHTHCRGWCLGHSLMYKVSHEHIVSCATAHRRRTYLNRMIKLTKSIVPL